MHFVALNATLCYNDCVSQNVVRKENEMKNARQTAILSIIEHNDIETQEDLAARLRDMGIMVTQATKMVLSPAMVPRISGHRMLSMASAAALALPARV